MGELVDVLISLSSFIYDCSFSLNLIILLFVSFGVANINSSAAVAAASLIARSLYILASDNNDMHSSVLGAINVNTSLVEELMSCLLSCEPGLSCEMVKNYIAPANVCPSHYVGVVIGEPSFKPYLGYVDDVSRFVWNFLADRTSTPKENASSRCSKDCTNEDEVCIRAEINGKGVCVISTTRYLLTRRY